MNVPHCSRVLRRCSVPRPSFLRCLNLTLFSFCSIVGRAGVQCHVNGNARLFPWQAADPRGALARHEGAGLSVLDHAFDRLARAAERLHADEAARGGDWGRVRRLQRPCRGRGVCGRGCGCRLRAPRELALGRRFSGGGGGHVGRRRPCEADERRGVRRGRGQAAVCRRRHRGRQEKSAGAGEARGCQTSGHTSGGSQALSQAVVETAKRPGADRPPPDHPAGPAYRQGRILRAYHRQVPVSDLALHPATI